MHRKYSSKWLNKQPRSSKWTSYTFEHDEAAILEISSGKETQKSWLTTQNFPLPKFYLAYVQFLNSLEAHADKSKLTMYRLRFLC